MENKKERVLTFRYPANRQAEKEALKALLDKEQIGYICYDGGETWAHDFVVRRSGRTWNEVMHLVNTVYATKYSFKTTYFTIWENRLKEVVVC